MNETKQRIHATSSMTVERYRKLLDKLGLSQRAAGRFLGVSTATAARMASSGENNVKVPPPIAMLLEVLVEHDITPDAALKLIGVNVRLATKAAQEQQPNKQPRFFEPV